MESNNSHALVITMQLWGFSPGFWRKQGRYVVIFAILFLVGNTASRRMEAEYRAEEGVAEDSAAAAAYEAIGEIRDAVHRAKRQSITIHKEVDSPPRSAISFQIDKTNSVTYFEDEGSFYRRRGGSAPELLFKDLFSAYFEGPEKGRNSLLVELHIWDRDAATGDPFVREVNADIPLALRSVLADSRLPKVGEPRRPRKGLR